MIFKHFTTSLSAILFFGFLSSTAAAADLKVGYVNLQKAIEMTSTGQKAQSDLKKQFESKQSEFAKKKSDLEKMGKDLEKKKVALSNDVIAKKQAELQEKFMEFQRSVQQSELDFRKKEQELTNPIVTKLREAVNKIAEEKKLDLVLHHSARFETVLFASSGLDITDEVVKKYEKIK